MATPFETSADVANLLWLIAGQLQQWLTGRRDSGATIGESSRQMAFGRILRLRGSLAALQKELPLLAVLDHRHAYYRIEVLARSLDPWVSSLTETGSLGSEEEGQCRALLSELVDLATRLGAAVEACGGPAVVLAHAPDFTWVTVRGETYHFRTPTQRAIIRELYKQWEASGRQDGCGLSVASLAELLDHAAVRLRVDQVFQGHPAKGAILRQANGSGWALHFGLQPQDDQRSTS